MLALARSFGAFLPSPGQNRNTRFPMKGFPHNDASEIVNPAFDLTGNLLAKSNRFNWQETNPFRLGLESY
jgi:hypothetical protein